MGSKISMSSTKFVFFRPIRKPRWPPGLWLRHFQLFCNHWKEFNKTWQEATSQRFHQVCVFNFFGPGLRFDKTFSTSSLQLLNGIQVNLSWQEASTRHSLPSLCFSGKSSKCVPLQSEILRCTVVASCSGRLPGITYCFFKDLQMYQFELILLVFYVTCNNISVIYVTAQMCRRTEEKLYLRSSSQHHRHFAGFFNVPVLHRHGTTHFIPWLQM